MTQLKSALLSLFLTAALLAAGAVLYTLCQILLLKLRMQMP